MIAAIKNNLKRENILTMERGRRKVDLYSLIGNKRNKWNMIGKGGEERFFFLFLSEKS